MTRRLHEAAELLENVNWDVVPAPALVSLVAPALPWLLRTVTHLSGLVRWPW